MEGLFMWFDNYIIIKNPIWPPKYLIEITQLIKSFDAICNKLYEGYSTLLTNQIPKSPSYPSLTDLLLTLIPSKPQLKGACHLPELQVRMYYSSQLISSSKKSPQTNCSMSPFISSPLSLCWGMHMLMNFIHTTAIIMAGSSMKDSSRNIWKCWQNAKWTEIPPKPLNARTLRMLVEELLRHVLQEPEVSSFTHLRHKHNTQHHK